MVNGGGVVSAAVVAGAAVELVVVSGAVVAGGALANCGVASVALDTETARIAEATLPETAVSKTGSPGGSSDPVMEKAATPTTATSAATSNAARRKGMRFRTFAEASGAVGYLRS